MLDDLAMLWRFATGLHGFLARPLAPAQCRQLVEESLHRRNQAFLLLMRRAVYGYPHSPYRRLLQWAGVELGDLEKLVNDEGVEGALEKLYDAGVRIALDEFKGRRPIRRSGFQIGVRSEDFDNPLLAREFEVQTSGSAGPRRRLAIDFDLLVYEAACRYVMHTAQGICGRPAAIWRPVPPGSSGLKNALQAAKMGAPLERWFSPNRVSCRPAMLKSAVFTAVAVGGARLWGGLVPRPEYVPLSRAVIVARWLAGKAAAGRPAFLSAAANSVVRICLAAQDAGLDLSGTVFRVGGEPFSHAKAQVVHSAGARTFSSWAMSESGPLGGGCANPEFLDEVHLYDGKAAVLQRPVTAPDGACVAGALHLTTLLPATPKIMLNVETGDYGVLASRRCGCLFEKLGLRRHLHTIRSYEKLTAGGMHVMGADVVRLVEEVLPARHGGAPTDYQVIEDQRGALTQVTVVVSPRVKGIDESRLLKDVVGYLASRSRDYRMMAQQWMNGKSLHVARRSPYSTATGKVPPLRVVPAGPGREGSMGGATGG